MLILRIPKSAAKQQITLNNDLSRLLISIFNHLKYLRFEICEFSWISIWNTINVIISHCCNNKVLLSLELHFYRPYTAITTISTNRRSKRKIKNNDDTKELIIKIKNSISRLKNLDYLAIFINESNQINQEIIKSVFNDKLYFIHKKRDDIKRRICSMDEYWEPFGIDPYSL